jgi:hypothetical protein
MPLIPTILEVEVGGSQSEVSWGKSEKVKLKAKRTGVVAQVVEYLQA